MKKKNPADITLRNLRAMKKQHLAMVKDLEIANELTSGKPDGWCDETELKDFTMGRKTKVMVGSISELVDKLDMTGPFVPVKLRGIK